MLYIVLDEQICTIHTSAMLNNHVHVILCKRHCHDITTTATIHVFHSGLSSFPLAIVCDRANCISPIG